MSETKTSLRGVIHLHSETGTEGGYWAFQDERFTTPNTTHVCCKKCDAMWDTTTNPNGPSGPVEIPIAKDRTLTAHHCPPGTHETEIYPSHFWSYDGLHVLDDGDQLTIFDKEDTSKVVWSGTISLKQHPLFTEHAGGMWIHADQNGIDRDTWAKWFFDQHPAELTRDEP